MVFCFVTIYSHRDGSAVEKIRSWYTIRFEQYEEERQMDEHVPIPEIPFNEFLKQRRKLLEIQDDFRDSLEDAEAVMAIRGHKVPQTNEWKYIHAEGYYKAHCAKCGHLAIVKPDGTGKGQALMYDCKK